ncbi:hypothetical protein CO180_01700, partial [candidate division WWE3 bacterium CG_4_9_14_3_um_filter_41_6]
MTIRTATTQDVYDIIKLNTLLFYEDGGTLGLGIDVTWPSKEGEEYFTHIINGKVSDVFLAEVEDEIVGYLSAFVRPLSSWRPVTIAELDSMFVLGDFRSQGIGKGLVEHFMKWAKEKNVEYVSVNAFSKNERALAFYTSCGFEQYSETL